LSADTRRFIVIGVAVTTAYVIAARLGFQFAFVADQVTTVWPPTGIAQAALLLWGASLWPAVWLGAFIANATTDAPLWTAAAVATGNTLEPVIAVLLLRSIPGFDPALRRIRDVVAFGVIAAGLATAISATIGVMTLCFAAVQPWARFGDLWTTWWLGDAFGAVVVAPALLTVARAPHGSRRSWLMTVAAVLGSMVLTHLVFGVASGPLNRHTPLEYIVFPFVIAAAVRLGQPATSLVVLGVSAVTIWNTVRGNGPFGGAEVRDSLFLLQVFIGVLAGTGVLLAAAIAERRTGERRRSAAHAVGQVLATASDVPQAAPAILEAICANLEWPVGALWLVDHERGRLHCVAVWSNGGARTAAFAEATRQALFTSGVGLPGRVWATGAAAWIEDVVEDANFPRGAIARPAGVHGAFAFPISMGGIEVLGVIECFNRTVMSPDRDLLRTMSTVGNQIGQFIWRKRVEAAVAESDRRTRAMLETALDAIIGMNHLGKITEFNPAAERIFGYQRDEALGRELADLLIPLHLRAAHREGLARYIATGYGPFVDQRVETTGFHADGHEFPVEVAITRVSSEDPPRFTGFVRDLTARAQAEREREQLLQNELVARRDAEAANRAKDQFLATLSHELRTPLNAIVGWTHVLLAGADAERTRQGLEAIDRNARLQARLVSDILDVSRIITGGLQLELQPVDLRSVISTAVDVVKQAADAKQVQLRTHVAGSNTTTLGDPQRLQQVVWNLLANAVKFSNAGGVVDVALEDAAPGVIRIRVTDTGEGIDADFLPFVFERFRQADESISRQHGGLGLGLAIVRTLVALHGGTVRADSDGPGTGATFIVELKAMAAEPIVAAVDEPQPAGSAPAPRDASPLASYRVVVVDDDADGRDALAAILTRAGARVQIASSADEALRLLQVARPNILLADIGMPGPSGYDLIREVRRRDAQAGHHLPAVAVTAYATSEDRERALAEGFDDHMSKPVSPAAIIQTVQSLCRLSGSAR
jgi:PAS domain S-box-containing protein